MVDKKFGIYRNILDICIKDITMAKKNDYFKTTPVLMTYKFFNDTVTLKREVYDLRVRDLIEMNKTIVVSIFDERNYEETILSIAKEIQSRQSIFRRIKDLFTK